jgi:hypothetical protein
MKKVNVVIALILVITNNVLAQKVPKSKQVSPKTITNGSPVVKTIIPKVIQPQPTWAMGRLVVKATNTTNLEIDKPDNVYSTKEKLYFSVLEIYYETPSKAPKSLRFSFTEDVTAHVLVACGETYAYNNVRHDVTNRYQYTILHEPIPAKYTISVFTENPIFNLKQLLRAWVDAQPLKIAYQFANSN